MRNATLVAHHDDGGWWAELVSWSVEAIGFWAFVKSDELEALT
jgi:hypothetical protein